MNFQKLNFPWFYSHHEKGQYNSEFKLYFETLEN